MEYLDGKQLNDLLDYSSLVEAIKAAFCSDYIVPQRHHHTIQNPKENKDSTLLLMPAWEVGKQLGVKVITVSPNNGKYDLPAVQGLYLLFDGDKGFPIALLDANTLTARRTAATSALASSFLSNKNSSRLLMVGTGALAPHLIKAHASVRPIKEVYIWGRNKEKAERVKQQMKAESFDIIVIDSIDANLAKADIISCATLSSEPLIDGQFLNSGQHIDLVGSYRPNMREANDIVIIKSDIYVDTYEGATKESGDLAIPLQEGIIQESDIVADLFELCQGIKKGREKEESITCFKSVGHACEDLAAAQLAFQRMDNFKK